MRSTPFVRARTLVVSGLDVVNLAAGANLHETISARIIHALFTRLQNGVRMISHGGCLFSEHLISG